jgi:hypothetical protein
MLSDYKTMEEVREFKVQNKEKTTG